jgi:phosphoribosylformimino-5-aminoimidazole carboxamide ribonucleotide (ProFAR) isomerase
MGMADAGLPSSARGSSATPVLVPNLYLDSGRVVEAVGDQFEPVLDGEGKPVDPFDAADRLVAKYQRFCVIDLEGLRRNRAQLEYLQELSRSGELWVDAGIRTGDQVIDVLVTGARRAILSTAFLLGPKELRRAWRLSTEVLFAVETQGTTVRSRGNDCDGQAATEAVTNARSLGVVDVVLQNRGSPVDWSLVRQLAAQGPLWVGDDRESTLRSRLPPAGAVGGFFDSPRSLLIGSEGALT